MSDDLHTCSYHCDRPGCIRAQRDELRDKVDALCREVEHWREARRTAIQAGDVLKAEHERLLSENLILQRGREEDERDHRGDMHALYAARSLVARQAEDEALWLAAITATEAYLQAALRELHAAVEGVRDE